MTVIDVEQKKSQQKPWYCAHEPIHKNQKLSQILSLSTGVNHAHRGHTVPNIVQTLITVRAKCNRPTEYKRVRYTDMEYEVDNRSINPYYILIGYSKILLSYPIPGVTATHPWVTLPPIYCCVIDNTSRQKAQNYNAAKHIDGTGLHVLLPSCERQNGNKQLLHAAARMHRIHMLTTQFYCTARKKTYHSEISHARIFALAVFLHFVCIHDTSSILFK